MIAKGKFVRILTELISKYAFYMVICQKVLDSTGANIMIILLVALFFLNLWGSLESAND
jgi:hypothetical protein